MKRTLLLSLLALFGLASLPCRAQTADSAAAIARYDIAFRTPQTALVLPARMKEVGLFSPVRFGLKNNMEIAAHPLAFLILPNVSVKKQFYQKNGWFLAGKLGFSYPSLFFKTTAKAGIFGILPERSDIPQIFALHAKFLATKQLGRSHFLTFTAGLDGAASFGKKNMASIDLPIVYPRTAAYYHGWTALAGINLCGPIVPKLSYSTHLKYFFLPYPVGKFNMEQRGEVVWRVSPKMSLLGGYKLIYGEYPYGKDAYLMPVVDLLWFW